jgi:hypothetical protein
LKPGGAIGGLGRKACDKCAKEIAILTFQSGVPLRVLQSMDLLFQVR